MKKITSTLAVVFLLGFSMFVKAQCPPSMALAAMDVITYTSGGSTQIANGATINCNSTPFYIWANQPNPFSNAITDIYTPCIKTNYNLYQTNERLRGTEDFFEGGANIGCVGPGGGCSFPIGGPVPPAAGAIWDLYFSYLDPTQQHDMVFSKAAGAWTNTTITVQDCWSNATLPSVIATPTAWNGATPTFTVTTAAGTNIGFCSFTLSPAVAGALVDFQFGYAYVNPAVLPAGTYTITYFFSGSVCGGTTTTFVFTVVNPYTATWTPPVNLCSNGACVSLPPTVSGTAGGTWSGAGVAGTTFCPSTSGAGSFPVTYSVGISPTCRAIQTNNISVNAAPVIAVGASSYSVCSGASVVISASGASTYTWAPGGSLSNSNSATPTATPGGTTVYTVTGSSAAGCVASSSATTTVTVDPPITISVGSPSYTMCPGSSVVISASGATTYTWTPPGSLSNPNSATPTASPGVTTVYTVTGASAAGCVSSSSATTMVTVNTPPTITVGSPTYTVCPGGTVGISVSGASTYTWSPAGSLDNPNSATPNSTPGSTTVYTVNGTDASGCIASSSATTTVTVNTPPTITVGSPNYTVCTGGTVGISVSGASTYTWSPAGSLDNANSATPNSTPGGTTVYTVTGTDASGCTATSSATTTVTVNPLSALTITANPASLCTGGTTTLTATGASSYTWSANLGGVSANPVSVTPVATDTYSVNGIDANGCSASTGTISVTVGGVLTVTITASQSSLCIGQTATLTASGATNYTWMPGGFTTTVITVNPTINTTYSLTGDNGGCSGLTVLTITVNPTPTVTIGSPTYSLCAGGTVGMSVSGASTYTWSPAASLDNANSATPNATPGSTTVYTVNGTDANGCTASAAATTTVTVNTTVTPTITANPASLCTGGTTTLTASGASTYTWSANLGGVSTNPVSVTPAGTDTYSVNGTDVNGCAINTGTISVAVNAALSLTITPSSSSLCSGQTATLTASGATNYTWMPGGATTTVITVSPGTNTTYSLAGDNGSCSGGTTLTITVTTSPTVTLTSSAPGICSGGTVTLTANGSATSYTWMPGGATTNTISVSPGSTTTYTLTGTDVTGLCTNTSTVNVTVSTTPTITASAASGGTVCAGQSIVLTGSGNATTYTWMPGSITSATISVNPTANTSYTLVGANGTCLSLPQVVTVTVMPSPTLIATGAADSALCGASNGVIHPVSVSGGAAPITYQWYNGSTPIAGATLDSLTGAGVGTYSVLITDANGCTTGATGIIVPGSPAVVASITPGSSQGQSPVSVTFTNNTTGATSYQWVFGTGTGSILQNPSATFTAPGTYTVVMTATNGGCIGTATATVIVDAATSIIIPNIFSPNGDGLNDNFMIMTTGMKTLTCDIFNRWGTKMSSLQAPNQVWDGKTPAGETASDGTYFFILKATGNDGKSYNYEGPLTLVK